MVWLQVGYIALTSLLHCVIFPEPDPDGSDLPRRGTTILKQGIRSKLVYRQTSIETQGQLFEWDNYVEPGGGPIDIPHVHPHLRETFEVIDGEMRFVINREEHIVRAGEKISAEPASVHAFQNVSGKPVHMVSRFEPAEDGPWDALARLGRLPDSTFVQLERAGGMGRVSFLQALVFISRYEQGYLPGIPTPAQDAVAFLVAPTARIVGIRAYYPPADADR